MKLILLRIIILIDMIQYSINKQIDFVIKIASSPTKEISEYQLFIPLDFISFNKTVNVLYDTSSNILVINKDNLVTNINSRNQIGNQPTNIMTTYGSFNGKIYSEEIALNNMKATFPFVIANNVNYNYKSWANYSIWGLGRHEGKFILNNYSNKTLIEHFSKIKSIPHSNFGHKFSNETTPKFIYGELINYKEYKYCSTNETKELGDNWYCNMKMVLLSSGSAVTIENRNAVFATGIDRVILPRRDYNKFIDEYILLTGCTLQNRRPFKIKCNRDIYDLLPNITFDMFYFNLHLNRSDYIISSNVDGGYYEYLSIIDYSDSNNHWMLGLPLLKKYDMMFDFETNYIVFTNIRKEDKMFKQYIKLTGAGIAFCSSLVLFIILISYVLYLQKRNRKNRDSLLLDNEKRDNRDIAMNEFKQSMKNSFSN